MRVKSYPHTALRFATIALCPMNKGIQKKYESMRVKWMKTFF